MFLAYTSLLRNSDSDYQVIYMVEEAYQTPPVYHQYTVRFDRARLGCARRPHALREACTIDNESLKSDSLDDSLRVIN